MSKKSGKTIEARIVRTYLPKEAKDMASILAEEAEARAKALAERIEDERKRTIEKNQKNKNSLTAEERDHLIRIRNAQDNLTSSQE